MTLMEQELRCVIADLKTQVQERDAVLKQALDALEEYEEEEGGSAKATKSIAAIKEILK